MKIINTSIPGVLIIEPRVFKDSRGYFFESFSQREFDEKVTPILGHTINFVQDNDPMSSYGVKCESVINHQSSMINIISHHPYIFSTIAILLLFGVFIIIYEIRRAIKVSDDDEEY